MSFMASTMLSFSPRQLFGAAEAGVWYDPSDLSTLWQDAQGTTAVTGVEQAVGLILDKRNGLGLGTELVTNSTFATDTDWTKGTGWSIGSGVATKSAGSASVLSQAVSLTAGITYRLVYTITRTAGSITPQFTGGSTVAGTAQSAAGTYVEILTAVSGNTTLEFSADASFAGTVDNVYLKRVSGNDAWQLTSNSRPVLSARVNLLTYTQDFSNAVWATAASGTAPTKSTTTGTRPDGTSGTIDTITFPTVAASGFAFVYQSAGRAIVDKQTTASVYARVSSGTATLYLSVQSSGAAPSGGNFYTASAFTLTTTWQQISISGTQTSVTGTSIMAIGFDTRTAAGQTNGSSLTVEMWGGDFRASDGVGAPAYQRVTTSTDYDTVGFPRYLAFDGTDDYLACSDNNMPTGNITIVTGARSNVNYTTNNYGCVCNYGQASTSNAVIVSFGTVTGSTNFVSVSQYGDSVGIVTSTIENVVFSVNRTSTSYALRKNGGASSTSKTMTTSTQTYGANGFVIGAYNAAISYGSKLNGRIYGLVIRGASSATGDISDAEGWMNSRTRAY